MPMDPPPRRRLRPLEPAPPGGGRARPVDNVALSFAVDALAPRALGFGRRRAPLRAPPLRRMARRGGRAAFAATPAAVVTGYPTLPRPPVTARPRAARRALRDDAPADGWPPPPTPSSARPRRRRRPSAAAAALTGGSGAREPPAATSARPRRPRRPRRRQRAARSSWVNGSFSSATPRIRWRRSRDRARTSRASTRSTSRARAQARRLGPCPARRAPSPPPRRRSSPSANRRAPRNSVACVAATPSAAWPPRSPRTTPRPCLARAARCAASRAGGRGYCTRTTPRWR